MTAVNLLHSPTMMVSPGGLEPNRARNLRVLLVEDDPEVAQAVHLYMQLLSCHVDHAIDGPQAVDRAVHGRYDAILLDLSLPLMDGLAVCRTLRQQQVFTPIIMLTARSSEGDKVIGFEAGADDYMTKPFSPLELQARLHALLRRANGYVGRPHAATSLEFGDLRIDVDGRTVTLRGRPVVLTAREFDLLVALARHPGRVYTREQLLDAVWGYSHEGYGHTVNSHINRLRAKIECDPARPHYVQTVWSVGYKFCEN
jgi:two-component system, OmpR family, response regulator